MERWEDVRRLGVTRIPRIELAWASVSHGIPRALDSARSTNSGVTMSLAHYPQMLTLVRNTGTHEWTLTEVTLTGVGEGAPSLPAGWVP